MNKYNEPYPNINYVNSLPVIKDLVYVNKIVPSERKSYDYHDVILKQDMSLFPKGTRFYLMRDVTDIGSIFNDMARYELWFYLEDDHKRLEHAKIFDVDDDDMFAIYDKDPMLPDLKIGIFRYTGQETISSNCHHAMKRYGSEEAVRLKVDELKKDIEDEYEESEDTDYEFPLIVSI